MIWYKTGTVSVTNGSGNVTGTSTKWVANVRDGDAFLGPDGLIYEITGRSSDTALTITPPYRGVTASGKAYALAPMQGYVKRTGDLAAQLLTDVGGALDLKLDVDALPGAVRGTVLAGLSTATAAAIVATDSLLVALGKAQAQITARAPLASPALTGNPTAPTQAAGNSSTRLASTAFVGAEIEARAVQASQVGSDPGQASANLHLGRMAFIDAVGVLTPMQYRPGEVRAVWPEFVSNTSLRLCMRGDDGVVRSTTLTLV